MTATAVAKFVVVALSARALVASAWRAGQRVAVLDLIADTGTAAPADPRLTLPSQKLHMSAAALRRALAAPVLSRLPLVYGAGFEDRPELLTALARGQPLIGCYAAMVVYCAAPVLRLDGLCWPDWTADRPRMPARISAGAPLCTVIEDGPDMKETRRLAIRRARGLCRPHALVEAA